MANTWTHSYVWGHWRNQRKAVDQQQAASSLLAFIKVLWLFQPAIMERCGTDGVNKWTLTPSLRCVCNKQPVIIHRRLLRQTEAPLTNKPCSSAVTVFSKALKSERNIV